jgi:serine/threonine protein kinase
MTVIGTIYYMSPELLMGDEGATFNTDIWSLGIMMHEMLYGCLPFGMQYNHAQGQIIHAIVNNNDLHSPVRKDLPEKIIAILQKSLEKDRKKRYQTAREMLNDIEKLESDGIKEGLEYKAYLEKKAERDYDAAALILDKLITRYQKSPELYIELGHIFQSQCDSNKALDVLNRGIAEIPDFGNLHFEAAILFNQRNDKEKTLEYLQNSLRLGISDRKNMIVAQTLIKKITETK